MFHLGQQVVCIDDTVYFNGPQYSRNDLDGLTKGNIYTIRWLGDFKGLHSEGLHIKVEEIVRHPDDFLDVPFMASRFRPLIEKKRETDISIFNKLLGSKKKHLESV